MFIQIAKGKSVRIKDVIGIFDLDTSTVSGVTKSFLSRAEKNGEILGISALPKSFVLTDKKEKKEKKIYFSSSMTAHIYKSKQGRNSHGFY